jgi:hydroxyacid-oxoacid transhydrogenase
MKYDYAFQMTTANIRFGRGATQEVGMDLLDMGVQRVMVVTDRRLKEMPPVQKVLESLLREGINYSLFDRVLIEPTDISIKEAISFATAGDFDAFVAVGGGSTIDTAKMANLYSTFPPDDFLDYVNAPIGKGTSVPDRLKPLIRHQGDSHQDGDFPYSP